ncbi:hypothetical protein FRC01_009910, partial [Tulasnella sp. 417]
MAPSAETASRPANHKQRLHRPRGAEGLNMPSSSRTTRTAHQRTLPPSPAHPPRRKSRLLNLASFLFSFHCLKIITSPARLFVFAICSRANALHLPHRVAPLKGINVNIDIIGETTDEGDDIEDLEPPPPSPRRGEGKAKLAGRLSGALAATVKTKLDTTDPTGEPDDDDNVTKDTGPRTSPPRKSRGKAKPEAATSAAGGSAVESLTALASRLSLSDSDNKAKQLIQQEEKKLKIQATEAEKLKAEAGQKYFASTVSSCRRQ